MPPPDDLDAMARALAGRRRYAGDHPILGRSPVVAPPEFERIASQMTLQAQQEATARRLAGIAGDLTGVNDALRAWRGEMTPEEERDFALTAAAGMMIPGGKGLVRYGGALAREAAPFFSAAERAIESAGLNKAPLGQWLQTLRNKGVKEEELNWLGLGKAPVGDTPGWTGHVTKDQLNDWIKGHGVQLNEINKNELPQGAYQRIGELRFQRDQGRGLSPTEQEELRNLERETKDKFLTKFQQYQLPGGSNYRETLLTLPPKPMDRTGWTASKVPSGKWEVRNPEGTPMYSISSDVSNADEAITRALSNESKRTDQAFTSSHWDEPNVLAHVRHNDRLLPPAQPGAGEPRKALFMEEVQSDWHQSGRRGGYQRPLTPQDFEVLLPLPGQRFRVRGPGGEHIAPEGWLRENPPQTAEDFIRELMQEQRTVGRVPDAPFKTSWSDLALKRMLAKAAHEGYDALAWTPGEVQATRYDLSKHLDSIGYQKVRDNNYSIVGNKGDAVLMSQQNLTEAQLADFVGKDVAQKIINNEGEERIGEAMRYLSGLDLRVGGEGMRAFYDKMLVDKANALGKRYGAKVGQEPLDVGEYKVNRDSYDPPFRLERRDSPDIISRHATAEDAWNKAEELGQQVHVLPITPELREAVKKGFPLFATGGITAAGVAGGGDAEPNAAKPRIEITPNPTAAENRRMLDALSSGGAM